MSRLGVLGWPVAHSRSPAIHNAALKAMGLGTWRYQRLPVPPHLLERTVHGLAPAGFLGANVTIPHKQAALELSSEASRSAREIGAANTLTFGSSGTIAAENTDAPGLLAALGFDPRGMRVQVLGAGGSARAAVWALFDAGAAEVAVWNRTEQRARELAEQLGGQAVKSPQKADLLVNCTSVGLTVERSATEDQALNQLGMTGDQTGEYAYVVDLVYRSGSTTPLLGAAASRGARTVDGLEVLISQGALSLELWTGREVPREIMREAVRDPQEDRRD